LTDFRKTPKFSRNPFRGSRVVPCGRTDGWADGQMDTQADITKSLFAISRKHLKRQYPFPLTHTHTHTLYMCLIRTINNN